MRFETTRATVYKIILILTAR